MREPRPAVEVRDAGHGIPSPVAQCVGLCERNDERRDAPLAQRRDERVQHSALPLAGDVQRLEERHSLAAVVRLRRRGRGRRSAPLLQQVPRPNRLGVIAAEETLEAGRGRRTELYGLVVGARGVGSEQASEVERRPERVDVLLAADASARI